MTERWPQYCCAFLRDPSGRFLLERRPDHDAERTGRLTCFGGERLPDEHPEDCIRRELTEELRFAAGPLTLRVRLMGTSGRVIAWFYEGAAPPAHQMHTEPGVGLAWASPSELSGLPIGSWNMAALIAMLEGLTVAQVDDA